LLADRPAGLAATPLPVPSNPAFQLATIVAQWAELAPGANALGMQ
jgi:hypothetical protein